MNKKEILKKYTGKGGLGDFTVGLGRRIGKVGGGAVNVIKSGIKQYKDYAAREKKLNDAASKAIGNVSSNEYNMNRMRQIKNKLRKSGNY